MSELSGELFTPTEVASFLNFPQETIDLWLELRTLPSFQTPNGRRIRRVDLTTFVEPLVEPDAYDSVFGP